MSHVLTQIQKAIEQAPDTAEYVGLWDNLEHRIYFKRDGETSLVKYDESCGLWLKAFSRIRQLNLSEYEVVIDLTSNRGNVFESVVLE